MIRKLCVVSMALPLILGGCGGSGDNTTTDARVFSEGPDDRMSGRISSAVTESEATRFQANASGIRFAARDAENQRASAVRDEHVAIIPYQTSPTAVPTIKVEALGTETLFGPEHYSTSGKHGYYAEGEDGERRLWALYGTWLDYAEGASFDQYLVPFYFQDLPWTFDGADTVLYGVIGLETYPGDMPETARATFSGNSIFDIWRANTGELDIEGRNSVTLNVDFGEETISGRLYEFKRWNPDTREYQDFSVNPDIAVNILETKIGGNGFSTVLAFNPDSCYSATSCPDLPDSFFGGKFYGPAAEEAGGTYSFGEFTLPAGYRVVGAGAWAANQE